MKILLVEDDVTTGDAIRSQLVERGHEVIWILGSESPDVTVHAISSEGKSRTHIDLTGVNMALVDSYLGDLSSDGTLIGFALQRAGIFCVVGIGSEQGNRRMQQAGAVVLSCLKDDVIAFVDRFVSSNFKTDTLPSFGPRVGNINLEPGRPRSGQSK